MRPIRTINSLPDKDGDDKETLVRVVDEPQLLELINGVACQSSERDVRSSSILFCIVPLLCSKIEDNKQCIVVVSSGAPTLYADF